jgi:hypothetical protein
MQPVRAASPPRLAVARRMGRHGDRLQGLGAGSGRTCPGTLRFCPSSHRQAPSRNSFPPIPKGPVFRVCRVRRASTRLPRTTPHPERFRGRGWKRPARAIGSPPAVRPPPAVWNAPRRRLRNPWARVAAPSRYHPSANHRNRASGAENRLAVDWKLRESRYSKRPRTPATAVAPPG